jgi:hypothetical protein
MALCEAQRDCYKMKMKAKVLSCQPATAAVAVAEESDKGKQARSKKGPKEGKQEDAKEADKLFDIVLDDTVSLCLRYV